MQRAMEPIHRAIILAAGRGKRLGALTQRRPKPMIPVRGRPLLEHILAGLRATGILDFLIVVGYRGEAIRRHLGDGAALGAHLCYAEQPVANGTGAALLLGRNFADDEPVVASFGDILTDYAHYKALLAEYDRAPCAAVLGINPVDDPSAGGAVYREAGRVTRVVEKPPPGTSTSHWNLAGVHVFSPAIFPALARIAPSPRGEYELTSGIAELLSAGLEVRACEMRGFWSDVGTPEALDEAERAWVSPGPFAPEGRTG